MSRSSIATEIAGKWGLAGSTNLVLWGLLAVLIALGVGIAGGWWNGSRLEQGKTAKTENKTLKADIKAGGEFIQRQQTVIADASAKFESQARQMAEISETYARERQETQRQSALVAAQLEAALATRPDLADVRVGSRVLDAWNAANAGRATGTAGAGQPAAADRPKPVAAKPGRAARRGER